MSALFWEIVVEVFLPTHETKEILHNFCMSIFFLKLRKKDLKIFFIDIRLIADIRLVVKLQDISA